MYGSHVSYALDVYSIVCVVTVVRTCSSAVTCKPTSRPVSSFRRLIFINDSRMCGTQCTVRVAVRPAAPPHLYELPQCLIRLFFVANK